MKINIEENISISQEKNDIKKECQKSKLTKEQIEEIDKSLPTINDIKNILTQNKITKQKEEVAYDEIYQYIKNEKIDVKKLRENENYTIAQKFCLDGEDYCLSCILLYLEKELNENDFFEYIIKSDNVSGTNIFEISSEKGDIKIFRKLKKYLINNIHLLNYLINDRKDGKDNIFHIAARSNKIISLLYFYSFYYNNNIYRSILNIKNKSTLTPLHISCLNGFYEFSQYLINLGANMNCVDKENKTPLFYAIQSNNIRIIKFLILSGANKYIKDNKGMIALNYVDDINIIDILNDKNCFEVACMGKTQFEKLQNHYRNIIMIILLIFFIIFHHYIIIKYKLTDFLLNCNYDIELTFDFIILIVNIVFEFLGIFFYILFQIIKRKKQNNNNSIYGKKFCIKENGIEYYELFKYNENLCVKCERSKEMNTKHCLICDVCIDEFDHHCFFLNGCFDKKNKIIFKPFVIVMFSSIAFNIVLSIKFFIDLIKEPKIYYGLIFNQCDFDKNDYKYIDYIIYLIDGIYCFICIYTILICVVPFTINLIKKKLNKKGIDISERNNTPLLPKEEDDD